MRPLIAPATRPLWTPPPRRRHQPWCPQYRRDVLNMASGSRLLDASGRRILGATGAVQLSNGTGDDCCCGGGDPCSTTYCSSPGDITVTFEDIELNTGACVHMSSIGGTTTWGKLIDGAAINGTFVVPRIANFSGTECQWEYIGPASAEARRWFTSFFGAACADGELTVYTAIEIRIFRSATQLDVDACVGDGISLSNEVIRLFRCNATLTSACSTLTAEPNTITAFSGVSGVAFVGKNGTVTITE